MSKSQATKQLDATQAKGLVKKLVEILAELGPIEKKGRNVHFGYNYTSDAQMKAELRPRLASRSVFLLTSVDEFEPFYGDGKAGVFAKVKTTHTFIDADSGEQLVVGGAGHGWDSGDKGLYKAITGAVKQTLMQNFLVSDEINDPEAGGIVKEKGAAGHRRTRPYEEETGEGDAKATADLLQLKAFLTQHKIPDGFLLTLLQEKKLIDGHTKNVGQLKPGILLRVLSPKSLENLEKAWKLHQEQEAADEAVGGQTPPRKEERSPFDSGVPEERGPDAPSSAYTPDEPPPPKRRVVAKHTTGDQEKEIRTSEGDQTRHVLRKPVSDDTDPSELLEQEGYTNWRKVPIHFGAKEGTKLGSLSAKDLSWWIHNWTAKPYKGTWETDTLLLDAALVLASKELANE